MMPMNNDEMERILTLSNLNLDYSSFENNFKDLARLAAKVSGTDISLINLIDAYTQWTISFHGLDIEQMTREESVCQYTIATEDCFEVKDLAQDARFVDKFYVVNEPRLRYYYGVPLHLAGHNIGALCVLDKDVKSLTPEKADLLKIIAAEIVNRLNAYKLIEALQHKVAETKSIQNKVVHDIRGPLSGIVGLAEFINAQGQNSKIGDVLEMINLIYKSGNSILELADEILSTESKSTQAKLSGEELTLTTFREKLYKLYLPQAKNKHVFLSINISTDTQQIHISKSKLLQITGNLISNAIKFTPPEGHVTVDLRIQGTSPVHKLKITVADTGVGIDQDTINAILIDDNTSTSGTAGEKGYGFGLLLVNHLIKGLDGNWSIRPNTAAVGTEFIIELPFQS